MEKELRDFGMSENEVQIYLTLLKTGVSTANRLAEITGMKRSTTYDNLKLLANKGLVSGMIKDKVSYYLAVSPKKILDIIDEKRENMEKIVPKLEALKEAIGKKGGVSFFEGKKGVVTVLNDILDTGKELWFYGSRKMALIALQHYPENFIQKRADLGIRLKAVLAEEDKGDSAYKDKRIFGLSSLKFLEFLNGISTNVFIYGNKVAFMTSEENPAGIIIESKEVFNQQKKIFEFLWSNASGRN